MGKTDKKISSRERGDEFEYKIANLLNFKQTANSGAMFDDADLRPVNGKPIIAEAKVKSNSPALRSDVKNEIDKLRKQADKIGKDWLYVIRNRDNEEFVICGLQFFAEATEEYFSERQTEETSECNQEDQ